MVGDCQRPACCISTRPAPAAASDWAEPTRREWPDTRPSTPAAEQRAVMIRRTERADLGSRGVEEADFHHGLRHDGGDAETGPAWTSAAG